MDQDQVTTQTGRKSVLVAHYVVSTAVTDESSYIVSTRDVSSFRIKWISIGPVKLVGEKGQWICIEAFLCGHLSVRDRTCLESKMTHVVSSEHTLKGDVGFWLVATLSSSGHDPSDGIRRQVVVVITYKPTSGFGSADVEAVRTCLNSRIGFGSTRPLSLDAGVVVS